MLPIGTTLAGYRVDGVLGQGGMGTVYEATQLSLDRVVALKLLAAHLSNDMAFRARFRREGQVQARLEHPHVVTVYEAGETEQGLFIAMRLVRGRTLKDLINDRELDVPRTLKILAPVAEALDEAHGLGLIHRDIKPQNVLVGRRDHSFLADFGLTKGPTEASLTKTGHFVGTFDYISPEQINGQPASAASDVYSLAGVLYECLTGTVPFPRPVEAAVLYAHVSEPPPRPSESRPELPADLDEVIGRAMAKDPAARQASAGELIEDVERLFGTRAESTAESVLPAPRAQPPVAEPPGTPIAAGGGAPVSADRTAAGPTAPAPSPPAPRPAARQRAADQRRSSAALPLLGAGALALVVAGGFLIGKSSSGDDESPPARGVAVTAGALGVQAPAGWKRADQPDQIAGLSLRRAASILPGGTAGAGSVTVGMSNATGPALLPASVARKAPDPEAVELGELQALRYPNFKAGNEGQLRVYAAPVTGAVATVACALPDDAVGTFVADCDRIAASLQLRRGEPIPLGPDKGYERKLDKAIGTLNQSTKGRAAALRKADTAAAQAQAATALEGAYRKAARSLRGATDNPQVSNGAVVAALNDLANAYGRLATAARAEDEAAYGAARGRIRDGEQRLKAALKAV
jgi:Protein kinase domain